MTKGPQRRPQMYVRPFSDPDNPVETPASEAVPMQFSSDLAWDRFAVNPVINGQQMRTLVDPVEHLEKFTHSIDLVAYGGHKEQMIEQKRAESRVPDKGRRFEPHGAGIYDWMKAGERMREPIVLRVPFSAETDRGYGQDEGHHRAVSGAEIQEEEGGAPRPIKFNAIRRAALGMESNTAMNARMKQQREAPESTPSPVGRSEGDRVGTSDIDALMGWAPQESVTPVHIGVRKKQPIAGFLGAPRPVGGKQADSSLERLLDEEEEIARIQHGHTGNWLRGG